MVDTGHLQGHSNAWMPIHGTTRGNVSAPRPRGVARSAFGVQSLSEKATMPLVSFSATTREQQQSVFLSTAHTAVEKKGRSSAPLGAYRVPGCMDPQPESLKHTSPRFSFSHLNRMIVGWYAGNDDPLQEVARPQVPPVGTYDLPSGIGVQADSRHASPPRFRIGTSTRDQALRTFTSPAHVTHQLGTCGPDPGHYALPPAIGPQPSSMRHSAPAFSLPKVDKLRDEYERLSKTLPAPGSYETWKSLGKQSLSQSKTMPAHAFGSSTRDKEEARFLTLAHTRVLMGNSSPPNYEHQTTANTTSFGRQVLSNRESPSRVGFGSEPRFVFKTSTTPGPGHYD